MGQTHVHKYMQPLLERIEKGEIDPSEIISHRLRLEQAPEGDMKCSGIKKIRASKW